MSRGAALYNPQVAAPALPDIDVTWPGRSKTTDYHLLGDDELFGGPRPLLLDQKAAWTPPLETGYLDQDIEMPVAYFASQDEAAPRARPLITTRVMLVAAIVLLLALGMMLVTPVLASGRFAGGQASLSISRYSDMSAGTVGSSGVAAPAGAAPVIDTTQPAAPAPEAAAAPQPPPAQPGSYNLVAPPSISVKQIESVLAQYGSPAAGHGQALYDLGVKYGIDPAYALAFFVHESGCGTKGVARFTNSLGNIRWTAGFENYEGYRKYGTWAEGIEDWYKLITDLYINGWNLRTVDAIIPVYAPSGDNNNPPVYIASVKSLVDSWRGK